MQHIIKMNEKIQEHKKQATLVKVETEKLFDKWYNDVKSEDSDFNILEEISNLEGGEDFQIKVLNGLIKYLKTKKTRSILLEKNLADKLLMKAKNSMMELSLYEIDYIFTVLNDLKQTSRIKDIKKIFKDIAKLLEESWD
jgi:hypothetical protein